MKIDGVGFGTVTIDSVTYTKDLLLFPGFIQENWWRMQGHSLALEDLAGVFQRKPAIFVMGCGFYNALEVPEKTREALSTAGIKLVALSTPDACDELNRLLEKGEDAACGLHLTC